MGALRTSIDLPYQARETLLIRHGRFGGCAPNIPATPGGGGVGPPTENGLSIFDPDDALATV